MSDSFDRWIALTLITVTISLLIYGLTSMIHEGTMKAIEKGYRPTERMGTIVWEPGDCK